MVSQHFHTQTSFHINRKTLFCQFYLKGKSDPDKFWRAQVTQLVNCHLGSPDVKSFGCLLIHLSISLNTCSVQGPLLDPGNATGPGLGTSQFSGEDCQVNKIHHRTGRVTRTDVSAKRRMNSIKRDQGRLHRANHHWAVFDGWNRMFAVERLCWTKKGISSPGCSREFCWIKSFSPSWFIPTSGNFVPQRTIWRYYFPCKWVWVRRGPGAGKNQESSNSPYVRSTF